MAFLDNLFLNVNVVHVLLKMGVDVMGTIRKNAASVPSELIGLKECNTPLLYSGNKHVVVGDTLYFA